MKIFKSICIASLAVFSTLPLNKVSAQAFTEGFDNIGTLAGSGWVTSNSSTPVGLNPNWAQGDIAVFNAQSGATNSFIFANFQMTTGANTISAWMLTPNRTFRNGDVISFYTRKPAPNPTDYPDRLQVRMSTNGASTNVGTGSTAVGDFTTTLLEINPTLVAGGYPYVWTQYTITISGLPAPTSGRIAFRYFVTNGGPSGSNSDFIGIDNVVYTPYVCPTFTMTTGGALTGGTAGAAYSTTLTQTGALGAPNFAVTAGALPPGLTMAANGTISGTPTATGTFNFTSTVNDNSGCSGSQSYSITVVCPANPITFSTIPALCSQDAPYTLTAGSPAGGTYSGTGVAGGTFDPAAGTQTVTYDYTNAYGCPYSSSTSITVNTNPTVTQSAIAAICEDNGTLALTGGSPAGGTYSGTGVTGSNFDPSAGTQVITYSYTDGNNCSNSDDVTITVNDLPVVTQSAISAVCEDAADIVLTGGSPAGGTYSGTGVTGGNFDPSSGTQTVTYSFTDANGCTSTEDVTITVNDLPSVTQDPIGSVCADAADIVLSGGAPIGGTYSGTGVTGGSFDPSAGTQTVTYTFTDGNSCTNTATTTITINSLPVVTLTLGDDFFCNYNAAATLTGGSPAGGSYTGTGVTAGSFNPATAGNGTYTITYAFTDANGCDASATDMITVDGCLGVDESSLANVVVYPNPSAGVFTVSGLTGDVKVTDVQGKLIDGKAILSDNGNYTVDISDMNPGIYLLVTESNQVIRLLKL